MASRLKLSCAADHTAITIKKNTAGFELLEVTQTLEIHPTHPQPRMLRMIASEIHAGAVVVYPTDTAFALGCHLGDKNALERIVRIRGLSKHHQFTLACRDLSELGTYARVDNVGYRLLRRATPGPYTWVMNATREVPRRLLHVKRRTIGMRVPDHPVAQGILETVAQPILTTTVRLKDADLPLRDAYSIAESIGKQVDLIVDDGRSCDDVSTVVDLTSQNPEILRQGVGQLWDEDDL